jgi:hypothetical protein
MSEPGFASLSPTLLARKGGAKPAMRPQLAALAVNQEAVAALADEHLEDLGWNDMGHDENHNGADDNGADVVPINAAVASGDPAALRNPVVRRQQRRLEERVLADAVMTGPEQTPEQTEVNFAFAADETEEYDEDYTEVQDFAPAAPVVLRHAPRAPARKPVQAAIRPTVSERRAAFTLRLDAERHLKLRLAATMQGVSAQVLLTEALDAMLAEFDDLDVIAAHLKRH